MIAPAPDLYPDGAGGWLTWHQWHALDVRSRERILQEWLNEIEQREFELGVGA